MDTLTLEIRPRPFGLGYAKARWPKAGHHVVRMGWTEVRLIVPNGYRVGAGALVALLVAGLFTR